MEIDRNTEKQDPQTYAIIGAAIEGESAAPVVRATPVTPDAADRSSGSTTAIVYDWRVGTSICEILKRSNRTAIASGAVDISGTSINKMFDGTCVKTIVLIRPIRLAMRAALSAESPARMFAPKKMLPMMALSSPNRTKNQ